MYICIITFRQVLINRTDLDVFILLSIQKRRRLLQWNILIEMSNIIDGIMVWLDIQWSRLLLSGGVNV